MAEETTEERIARITAWESDNKTKPKKTDVIDSRGRLIQTEEISDDGRIILTKTNPNGL